MVRRRAPWHTTFLPVQPGSSADTVSPPLESPISARDLMDVVISRRVARSYLKRAGYTHEHIFAVVPRASPLSQRRSHTLPSHSNDPPPPPRGGLDDLRAVPLLPPLRRAGARGRVCPVRVFFNTTSGCLRRPDERCRPVWTNRPPPSGEDGHVYPAGTASSVSWRITHTHG